MMKFVFNFHILNSTKFISDKKDEIDLCKNIFNLPILRKKWFFQNNKFQKFNILFNKQKKFNWLVGSKKNLTSNQEENKIMKEI